MDKIDNLINELKDAKVNEENCTEYDIGYNDAINFAISKIYEYLKIGKWVDDDGQEIKDLTGYCATCSACGEWSEYLTDYCPNCGARMVGENDDT